MKTTARSQTFFRIGIYLLVATVFGFSVWTAAKYYTLIPDIISQVQIKYFHLIQNYWSPINLRIQLGNNDSVAHGRKVVAVFLVVGSLFGFAVTRALRLAWSKQFPIHDVGLCFAVGVFALFLGLPRLEVTMTGGRVLDSPVTMAMELGFGAALISYTVVESLRRLRKQRKITAIDKTNAAQRCTSTGATPDA